MRTLKQQISRNVQQVVIVLSFIICHLSFSVVLTSCGKDEIATDTTYENWQERNDAFFASLEDSLSRGVGTWMKFRSYSRNPESGNNAECIYAKVLSSGKTAETESPMYNDSVRVSYQGRLMPTKQPLNGTSFEDGLVFDGTIYGTYDVKTNATARFKVSGLVNGFATALLHMHRGDTWLIYIPYGLGYGSSSSNTSIPAYSTLIFKVTLHEFAREGKTLPKI